MLNMPDVVYNKDKISSFTGEENPFFGLKAHVIDSWKTYNMSGVNCIVVYEVPDTEWWQEIFDTFPGQDGRDLTALFDYMALDLQQKVDLVKVAATSPEHMRLFFTECDTASHAPWPPE